MNLLIVILFGLTGFFSAIIVTFYSLLLGVKRTNDILLSQNAILEKTAQESYIKLAALEQKLQVVQSEGSSSNFLVTALIVTSVIVVVVSVCIILSSNASVANSLTKAASEHTRSVANDIELLNTKMTKAISKASDSSLENAQIIVDDITKVSSKLDGKLDNVRDGIISGLEQSDAAVGSVLERVVHEQMETNIILNSVQMSHMRIMNKISNASEISTENDRVIVEGITNISSKLDSISTTTTTNVVTSALEDPDRVEVARTLSQMIEKISNASEIPIENNHTMVEGMTNISSKLDSISTTTTTDIVTSALEDPNSVEMARTIVNAAFGA